MLLELLTGRRPVDAGAASSFLEDSLVDWARPALSRALADGDYDGVADPRLQGSYDPVEMARLVASAAAAVRHSAKKRPKMSQIVRALEGEMSLEDLNEGVRPGQSMTLGTAAAAAAASYKTPGPYTSDMERIRQAPMAVPEYGSAVTRFSRPSPFVAARGRGGCGGNSLAEEESSPKFGGGDGGPAESRTGSSSPLRREKREKIATIPAPDGIQAIAADSLTKTLSTGGNCLVKVAAQLHTSRLIRSATSDIVPDRKIKLNERTIPDRDQHLQSYA